MNVSMYICIRQQKSQAGHQKLLFCTEHVLKQSLPDVKKKKNTKILLMLRSLHLTTVFLNITANHNFTRLWYKLSNSQAVRKDSEKDYVY